MSVMWKMSETFALKNNSAGCIEKKGLKVKNNTLGAAFLQWMLFLCLEFLTASTTWDLMLVLKSRKKEKAQLGKKNNNCTSLGIIYYSKVLWMCKSPVLCRRCRSPPVHNAHIIDKRNANPQGSLNLPSHWNCSSIQPTVKLANYCIYYTISSAINPCE